MTVPNLWVPWVDPAVIMIEALALEVPEYPAPTGLNWVQAVYTSPASPN